MRCDKYMGDSDGTSPQTTCIRASGHPGRCDNLFGDFQVWGIQNPNTTHVPAVPISNAYQRKEHANVVRAVAESQLLGFWMFVVYDSASGQPIDATRYVSDEEAVELFGRLGWRIP